MKIAEIKQSCAFFVQDFPADISVYLFGSAARKKELDMELDTVFDGDIDLLFEVDMKKFSEFRNSCLEGDVNFVNGEPYDPMDLYWAYYSAREVRFRAALETLGIDESLSESRLPNLFPNQKLDIPILPFGWMQNKKVLKALNYFDPSFSANIQRDAKLILEKKNL
jgi:predicted nucleotidyltransferase